MAEILLSLTIIGVVAAITLPSLTGNINERTWNTQRKALYSRLSQAVSLMPSLNNYGTLSEDTDGNITVDNTAETFITAGLAKVLKINNICDNEHLADCGIPKKLTTFTGSVINPFPRDLYELNSEFGLRSQYNQPFPILPNSKAAAFETQNGESIAVFYNNKCQSYRNITQTHYVKQYMCANFVYDLNGKKGPNTVGKDIGTLTLMYPTNPAVAAPVLASTKYGYVRHKYASGYCRSLDPESRVPSMEELASLFFNKNLWGCGANTCFSSTITPFNPNNAWVINFYGGGVIWGVSRGLDRAVYCIKR